MAKLTETEISLIKNTFKGNETLLIAMRKIFLPTYQLDAPIGDQSDLWMNVEIDGKSPEEAIINIKARALFMAHMEGGLTKLKVTAEQSDMTPEEIKKAKEKDSTK
jgi:hypothetical protein